MLYGVLSKRSESWKNRQKLSIWADIVIVRVSLEILPVAPDLTIDIVGSVSSRGLVLANIRTQLNIKAVLRSVRYIAKMEPFGGAVAASMVLNKQ